MLLEKILLFVFGAGMGSAANALIDRLPRNESWFRGRSHCDECGHALSVLDLVPIFSYVFLKGKCRYCHKSIPYRNLLIEMLMGIAAISIFRFPFSIQLSFIYFFMFWLTVIIALTDMETHMVSEAIILIWGILSILNGFSLEGGLVGLLIIGGIWAFSRGKAMGFGDVEIALVMGLSLGWQKMLVALWLAFVLGAMIGLLLMAWKKAKAKSVIAFGPFLILGYWMAFVTNYVPW